MDKQDLEGFAAHLLLNNRRPGTVKRHLKDLRLLLRELTAWDKPTVDLYLASLKTRGLSSAYLNNTLATIRIYARFKDLDPSLYNYPNFKVCPTIKATLSDSEIEAFLGLQRQTNWHREKYYRWQVFWSILAFSGARPGEIAHLDINSVDFGRNLFIIKESKTNQPRYIPIAPNILGLLKEYLAQLKGEYLFPSGIKSSQGKIVISDGDWEDDFKKRIKLLGIKRTRLTPYSFRHSMATSLLSAGASLFHVKKLLGHSNIATTEIYSHLCLDDVAKALTQHPLVRRGSDPKSILEILVELIKSFRIEKDDRFFYKLEEGNNSLQFFVRIK